MAADDVTGALAKIAASSPVNGIVEIGGPEPFRLDELVRLDLAAFQDPREVISDPNGRYYSIHVSERTLVPGNDARLGECVSKTGSAPPTKVKKRACSQHKCGNFEGTSGTERYVPKSETPPHPNAGQSTRHHLKHPSLERIDWLDAARQAQKIIEGVKAAALRTRPS